MELHPLPGPFIDVDREIAAGRARMLRQGPRTLSEILAAAVRDMDEQDELEEYARDPVAWVRAHRPRRRLWDVLFR